MPGTLTTRDMLMANEPNPRPITRGRLYASNEQDAAARPEAYNRGSLALDPDPAYTPHAPSHVYEWPRPAAAIAPSGALWRGEDPFKYERSKTSNVISFVLHAGVVAGVLYL